MILSIHTGHDANLTISNKEEIILFVEFEKLVKQRYFSFKQDIGFEEEFHKFIKPVISKYIHQIDQINFCWLTEYQKHIFEKELPNIIYIEKKHHISHAYSLYAFTEPCHEDLIISFDGGGDENDYFKIFNLQSGDIKLIDEFKVNLGTPYRILGHVSDELYSTPEFIFEKNLHLPGKIMGLHSLGNLNTSYIQPLIDFYMRFSSGDLNIENEIKHLLDSLYLNYDENYKLDTITSRDLLFTSQYVFEYLFSKYTEDYVSQSKYKRIMLVGGCALNVNNNTNLYEISGKNVFVSPVSGDCGISIGAAISDMDLFNHKIEKNAFIGLPYSGDLRSTITRNNGVKVNTYELAGLLADGYIIATMVGNIEAGPRSLGNRSLLASPLLQGIKDKMNKIKEREYFRPVAPVVRDISQLKYFTLSPESRYMSFSPRVHTIFTDSLGDIVHYDNSSRIQTVSKNDSFLYDLLTAFTSLTGIDILINTSFNIKGKPMLNDIDDAFHHISSTAIDYLYIDGYLFEADENYN